MVVFLVLLSTGYLLGSIPFGKLIARRYGIDIQKRGSKNIGFANVMRVLGWRPASLVLIGDVLKGFIPTFIAVLYNLPTYQIKVIALAAIVGHIYPIWLKFRGGKGIATGLGITLAINQALGLAGLLVYCIAIFLIRRSGPSSVLAAWSLPLFCAVFQTDFLSFYLFIAVVATYTHRSNVRDFVRNYAA